MKRKVRIKSLPQGYHMMPDGTVMKDSAHMAEGGTVNKNLSPIPRGMANLEAERGEVAMTDLGNTGMMGLYNIGGERHSNGGTPLNLDPGSFIYSDTRKMKIKDPEFLAKYGKTKPVTPAKLVKPFLGINDFTNTLYDDNADLIQKRTAQSMIDKYKGKAGEIAFYQEAMKGFPQGVPTVAQDYAESIMSAPMMAYGGYLPKAQNGIFNTTDRSTPRRSDKFQAINPDLLKVLSQAGLNPLIDEADYSDQDRLEYNRIQEQIAGYPGMYEDAMQNFPGWVKRMGSLGYDFADWKDAEGNFDLKSLKPRDPRVRAYQQWWNPRVDQFIAEENEKRQDAGYPAFTETEVNALRTQKFYDPNDPNSDPGAKIDSKLGTYTTTRLLAEGEYDMQAGTVYFCVDGQVMGQSVRPGSTPTPPSGESVKGPYKTQQEAQQNCVGDSSIPTPTITPTSKTKTYPFQQDVNNVRTNLRNRLSEDRFFGYGPRLPYNLMDAVYLDDTREQQQISGTGKGYLEALGAFAGPSRQGSMASVISGQSAEQAANAASRMGNANNNIANTTGQFNATSRGATNAANARLAMDLYDKDVTTQEVFGEKMRAYNTASNRLKNTLETNRAKAQLFNQLYPDFQINTMPGMYGEITANPEVLRAMQDPAKYKNLQSDRRQQLMDRVTQEAFTFFPEKVTQDGKDENAAARADYIKSLMTGKNSEVEANPMSDPLRMLSALFSQYGGY